MQLACSGNLQALTKLVSKVPQQLLNTDSKGKVPLHHAAYKGQVKVIDYIAANGASEAFILFDLPSCPCGKKGNITRQHMAICTEGETGPLHYSTHCGLFQHIHKRNESSISSYESHLARVPLRNSD